MAEFKKKPDHAQKVAVEGGNVVTYSYGNGSNVLMLLQGGPGAPCGHLVNTHAYLADHGYRVVFFDQLGTGAADKPTDPGLWTIERYAREVEAVRAALNLGKVHLYGHSWGAMLAIEYACTFTQNLRSLIIAHGVANAPFHRQEINRFVSDLGPEFVRMRHKYELKGDFSAPEYQHAEMVLLYRHGIRMRDWPEDLMEDLKGINTDIRDALIGQEYYWHGNLRNWNRIPDMHRITQPTLILTGEHDALSPSESEEMHSVMPNSRLHIFSNIAHCPFYECPAEYYPLIESFWQENR